MSSGLPIGRPKRVGTGVTATRMVKYVIVQATLQGYTWPNLSKVVTPWLAFVGQGSFTNPRLAPASFFAPNHHLCRRIHFNMGIYWIKSSLEQTDIPGPVRGFFYVNDRKWCFKQNPDMSWELWEFDCPNKSTFVKTPNVNDLIQSAKILSGEQQ